MQHYFEIYLLQDTVTEQQWDKLYLAIYSFAGRLTKFDFIFRCNDNVVRFFIRSDKDLAVLSNNLEGLLLRPVGQEELDIPEHTSKARLVNFVSGGNILDLKEKLAVKRSLQLEYGSFTIRVLGPKRASVQAKLYAKNAGGQWAIIKKRMVFFPDHLFNINFVTNTHYLKKSVPRYLNIEKSLYMLSSEQLSPLVEVDTFPYQPHNYFLNLNSYEFDKHSFIIGATGSGKSKFISLYVDRLYRTALKNNYRIIVIDPHASLAQDFDYLEDKKVINFSNESTGLFPDAATDVAAATELTTTLFKSLLGDQFTPRLERLLRFTLFVLFTAQNMSLDTLRRFLTELELRNQILEHVSQHVPANIIKFFGSDFNEIRTQYYNEAILPIVALVDEMQLQPSLVGGGELSMAKTVQDNFLTVFSLNKVSMGEKTVKTIAGLLIQQIFLLAQARLLNQKVILIIDEVSVVQNPAIAAILAEARKFNLSIILTQQYFGQIEKDLQAAIFSNTYNYYVFRVSQEDARAIEGNLNMELPRETMEADMAKGLKESDVRVRMLTELHPRELMMRLSANGKLNPCVKARTVDAPTIASEKQWTAPELSTYTPGPASLPKKFDESAAMAKSVEVLSSAPSSEASAPIAQLAPQPPAPPPEPIRMNLSQLMASQSSSRRKVTKGKE
jgi:hypothetical protein